jgi:hypothetical protein
MSTSKNSLGFARVAATIAAAILVLAAASGAGAQDVSHSEGIQASGVADAKPAPGFANTIHPIVNKPPPGFVITIHPIIVGGLGRREHRHDRDHDHNHHDRRHAGNQRAEEVGAGKDSSRPPGVSQPFIEGLVD